MNNKAHKLQELGGWLTFNSIEYFYGETQKSGFIVVPSSDCTWIGNDYFPMEDGFTILIEHIKGKGYLITKLLPSGKTFDYGYASMQRSVCLILESVLKVNRKENQNEQKQVVR